MAKLKGQTEKPDSRKVADLVGMTEEALGTPAAEPETLERIKVGYQALTAEDKPRFFSLLVDRVDVKPEAVLPLLDEAAKARQDPVAWRQAMFRLRAGVESPRIRLFRQFITVPGGLKFLLDLRADILAAQRQGKPEWGLLDHDLMRLFEAWFQHGFLFLEEITLDSPYRQVELIKRGDMVHPMTTLEEMEQRMGWDRRCFALYHHVMPDEPIVFIEVALTKGIVRSIHDIIGQDAPSTQEDDRRDTAIFYSINNTQNGLAGVGLGKTLIFQVVEYLKKDVPTIRNFCTLSPMPGFWRRYLQPLLEGRGRYKMDLSGLDKLFDKGVRALLEEEFTRAGGEAPPPDLPQLLLGVFSGPGWAGNRKLVKSLAKPITRLGYHYLSAEKGQAGRPLDPVAGFHLGNGAALLPGNVNFGADWSTMGRERSLSLMVNYVYSQSWLNQVRNSMTRLSRLLPWLPRPQTGKPG